MRRLFAIAAAAVLCGAAHAGAVTIDFEDLGVAPGDQIAPFSFVSGGFVFTTGPDSDTFTDHVHVGSATFWPHNGTTILLPHGHVIMEKEGGGLFSLDNVQLAGWPLGLESPIHIIGTYADDTTVTQIMLLDGLVDGIGGVVDFQGFALLPSFSGLKSVQFKLNGTGKGNIQGLIGIDDVEVDEVGPIPEPTTLLLLGSGLVGFAARRRRRRG